MKPQIETRVQMEIGPGILVVRNIPLMVQMSPKNKWWLNLNRYRNANHFTLNKVKEEFTSIMVAALSGNIPFEPPYELHYILYTPTAGRVDLGNVLSIVDKFMSDALVAVGMMSDDSVLEVRDIRFSFGGVDRENPRADLEVRPWKS